METKGLRDQLNDFELFQREFRHCEMAGVDHLEWLHHFRLDRGTKQKLMTYMREGDLSVPMAMALANYISEKLSVN